MSSSRGASSSDNRQWKRLPRACDECKRRKIRCNSESMPGKRCSNCITSNSQCTHVEVLNALGSARGYVLKLEKRVKSLESLCSHLQPGIDIDQKLEELERTELDRVSEEPAKSTDEDFAIAALSDGMHRLVFSPHQKRFYGKACCFSALIPTLVQKRRYLFYNPSAEPWLDRPATERRMEMWEIKPWPNEELSIHRARPISAQYDMPSDDLLQSLVTLYFNEENTYLPLLHRLTFEADLKGNKHRYDSQFAATVLLVCALGAASSDDPRVYVDGKGFPGWRWFIQIAGYCRLLADPTLPSIYEVQIHALATMYLLSCGMWRGVYLRTQMALKLVQDVGAHTRQSQRPNAHTELWKRAFWVLLCLDVHASACGGTQPSLTYEDFDIDYPVDCDDEYWDHPDEFQNFQQPVGKPSRMGYFISLCKLVVIKMGMHRALYTVRRPMKTKMAPAPSQDDISATHDEQLALWQREIPPNLRDDSTPEDPVFARQKSVLLYMFHNVRLFAHQPHIFDILDTEKMRQSRSAMVCQSAIDAAAQIIASLGGRPWPSSIGFPYLAYETMFVIAHILLMYGTKRATRQDMEKIETYLSAWRRMEKRLPLAGAEVDIAESLLLTPEDIPQKSLPGSRASPSSQASPSGTTVSESGVLPTSSRSRKRKSASSKQPAQRRSPTSRGLPDIASTSTLVPPSFDDPFDTSLFDAQSGPPWYEMPGVDLATADFAWANTLIERLDPPQGSFGEIGQSSNFPGYTPSHLHQGYHYPQQAPHPAQSFDDWGPIDPR
ncbi:hypothetical protein CYLTODRAFT_383181 [Cylindrobasidium torrendii FP15055 ss-10]|uniref:Zn(2)-C6 fungal-type domain-containing protein n=1 Tax=Cylindrobasidium torrendii FP15055 ss-10 TaxID=1314674 RepID=A0A0D7AY30_9AGAR|nr:hypothetical protein CYLTODRAFT_383181 [Cylindrobasidium torrendii FP15055 ss-10]